MLCQTVQIMFDKIVTKLFAIFQKIHKHYFSMICFELQRVSDYWIPLNSGPSVCTRSTNVSSIGLEVISQIQWRSEYQTFIAF